MLAHLDHTYLRRDSNSESDSLKDCGFTIKLRRYIELYRSASGVRTHISGRMGALFYLLNYSGSGWSLSLPENVSPEVSIGSIQVSMVLMVLGDTASVY